MQGNRNDRQNNQEDLGLVRTIGGILGRIFATVAAAVTMRIVGNDAHSRLQTEERTRTPTLIQECKRELPVAATTLLIWNTRVGEETGAIASEFLVNSVWEVISSYLYTPSFSRTAQQNPSMTETFMTNISYEIGRRFTRS